MLTPVKNERYISIKADGLFHEVVSKDKEGAVLREYKLKDGTEGSKWELLYKSIDNVHVKNIRFEDSDYGENILLTLTDGENEVVWSENTGTNFGTDLMKKLPNLNFSEKASFKPYAFQDERGKDRRGVGVFQGDKITNFFFDGEKNIHGFPEPQKPREDMKTADWKVYFLNVQIFLVDYVKEKILPKFVEKPVEDTGIQYPPEEINPEDIPF